MAQSKEEKKRYIPDLLASNVLVEVIKIWPDGTAEKREMLYGDWKSMKKQPNFTYRCYQKGVSQFLLKNN